MLENPAFIIVDLQNDFGKERKEETESYETDSDKQSIIENVNKFLQRYRESGRDPIFIRTLHHEYTVSEEWKRRYEQQGYMKCHPDSEGAEFVPELDVYDDDVIVTKHRYNGFYQTDLDQYLSTNEISHVLFAGISTNVCVMGTLRGAYTRDYRVTLLSDCVGSRTPELHEMSLQNVQQHFGDVKESSEIELD